MQNTLLPPEDENPWELVNGIGASPLTIPNELSENFSSVAGRKQLIELYGNLNTSFSGVNADGEDILVSFDTENGIVLRTNQHNGWYRINYYDKEGLPCGETFDGRWKTNNQEE